VLPFYSFLSPASPFPTHWLPRVGSPLFWRYYEDAKTSDCSSPRSSFPSSDGYLLNSISFARLGLLELLPRRLGVGRPVSFGGRQSVLSSSQGTLSCFCPALGPRSDLHAKPFTAFRFCPRCSDYEGSNVDHYFEALSHGFRTAPYASCRHRCRLRNVRFRLVANLCRVGFSSHWVPALCFRFLLSVSIT
jgi:hypothetical protein